MKSTRRCELHIKGYKEYSPSIWEKEWNEICASHTDLILMKFEDNYKNKTIWELDENTRYKIVGWTVYLFGE